MVLRKYFIVCLIKGDAEIYNETLKQNVAQKFGVNGAIERKSPAHITLKYSFEIESSSTDKIQEVEKTIKQFCSSHQRTKYQLKGFGHFDNSTIFMKVNPSKEMINVYQQFINELKQIPWMTWKKFDNTLNFHASVAHTDVNETNFQEIWDYVNKNQPRYNLFFDNVTLLKMVDGFWKVHEEFKID